ncbi:hypothetical protein MnTg04_01187 [bacterium MnTg04]|nr:hypothetical protein MnTg04_01187 [bacterium MnTg04]
MDSSKLKNLSDQFKGRVKYTAEHAIDQVKNGTQVVANAVDSLTSPAHILNDAGSKLNDLSHDYFGRLLKGQRKIVDGVVEDSAKRLRVMADAGNLKEFWDDQVALFPATRERMVANVRETLEILGHTRDGLKELVQSTVLEFKGKKTPAKTSKRRAATKKTTAKKKSASKKTAGRKAKPVATPEKAA